MDFEIPADIQDTLDQLDAFIDAEIKPLEEQDDNVRFFDHRREWARTDFDNDGVPRADWEALLREMRRRADAAGWLRLALPSEFGGQDASNLKMAIIREHLAAKGLGLHNDLQNESSIVGNFPTVLMMRDFGTEAQADSFAFEAAYPIGKPFGFHGLFNFCRTVLPTDALIHFSRSSHRRLVCSSSHSGVPGMGSLSVSLTCASMATLG